MNISKLFSTIKAHFKRLPAPPDEIELKANENHHLRSEACLERIRRIVGQHDDQECEKQLIELSARFAAIMEKMIGTMSPVFPELVAPFTKEFTPLRKRLLIISGRREIEPQKLVDLTSDLGLTLSRFARVISIRSAVGADIHALQMGILNEDITKS